MFASIYIPPLAGIFAMIPLNIMDWGAILLSSLILSRIQDFLKDVLFLAKMRQRPSFGV
jgi:P-type Ca2+ transporter type 2C